MHICVDNLTIICSGSGLAPGWRQALWTHILWNFNCNFNSFIQGKDFEKVVCEIAAVLSSVCVGGVGGGGGGGGVKRKQQSLQFPLQHRNIYLSNFPDTIHFAAGQHHCFMLVPTAHWIQVVQWKSSDLVRLWPIVVTIEQNICTKMNVSERPLFNTLLCVWETVVTSQYINNDFLKKLQLWDINHAFYI